MTRLPSPRTPQGASDEHRTTEGLGQQRTPPQGWNRGGFRCRTPRPGHAASKGGQRRTTAGAHRRRPLAHARRVTRTRTLEGSRGTAAPGRPRSRRDRLRVRSCLRRRPDCRHRLPGRRPGPSTTPPRRRGLRGVTTTAVPRTGRDHGPVGRHPLGDRRRPRPHDQRTYGHERDRRREQDPYRTGAHRQHEIGPVRAVRQPARWRLWGSVEHRGPPAGGRKCRRRLRTSRRRRRPGRREAPAPAAAGRRRSSSRPGRVSARRPSSPGSSRRWRRPSACSAPA